MKRNLTETINEIKENIAVATTTLSTQKDPEIEAVRKRNNKLEEYSSDVSHYFRKIERKFSTYEPQTDIKIEDVMNEFINLENSISIWKKSIEDAFIDASQE